MKAQVVEAGKGWQWIVDGFGVFRKYPLMWIMLTIVVVLLWMVSLPFRPIGPLLFTLLWPVLFAGLMLGCKAVEGGEALELSHLFAGFQKNAASLVTIGGVNLVGSIVIYIVVAAMFGASTTPVLPQKTQPGPEALAEVWREVAPQMLVGSGLSLPLLMLIWFAPLLVVFHDLKPVEAMKLSFSACLVNWLALLVYGAVILVLSFVAVIPLFLGLVVLVPVLICSVYTSYKDIFDASGTAPASGNPFLKA